MTSSALAVIVHASTPDELLRVCRDICAAAAFEGVGGSLRVHAQLLTDAADLLAVRGMGLRASSARAALVMWS